MERNVSLQVDIYKNINKKLDTVDLTTITLMKKEVNKASTSINKLIDSSADTIKEMDNIEIEHFKQNLDKKQELRILMETDNNMAREDYKNMSKSNALIDVSGLTDKTNSKIQRTKGLRIHI